MRKRRKKKWVTARKLERKKEDQHLKIKVLNVAIEEPFWLNGSIKNL